MKKLLNKVKNQHMAEGNLILILFVFIIFLSVASPHFLSFNNISNLVRQTSVTGIIALGMTFVIISGGIDLSVGSIVGLASVLSAMLMVSGIGIFFSIVLSLVACTILGVINGMVIYHGKVPPFIATLGMMTAARGVVMLLSNARMIVGLPKTFTGFSQKSILGMPSLFLVWLFIIIITYIITAKSVFGRNMFAYGSNIEAARLSGINIRNCTYLFYAISGLMSGVAGILMTSRLANGIPTAGTGYELDAIAAVVVGGASLSGGSGTILGTVLGAFLIAIIKNGGNLLGINSFILEIAVGVLIVISVMIDQKRKESGK